MAGSGKIELLWENTNPTSNFAAQTVTIDKLSQYNLFVIVTKFSTNGTVECSEFATKATRSISAHGYVVALRSMVIGDTTIEFADGNYFATYGNSNNMTKANNMCIPLRIYGIK